MMKWVLSVGQEVLAQAAKFDLRATSIDQNHVFHVWRSKSITGKHFNWAHSVELTSFTELQSQLAPGKLGFMQSYEDVWQYTQVGIGAYLGIRRYRDINGNDIATEATVLGHKWASDSDQHVYFTTSSHHRLPQHQTYRFLEIGQIPAVCPL